MTFRHDLNQHDLNQHNICGSHLDKRVWIKKPEDTEQNLSWEHRNCGGLELMRGWKRHHSRHLRSAS